MSTESEKAKELTFPVPWGIIAAKAHGDPCGNPVLILHGIQDNAGSFDRLIPYLPKAFYYVCLDLPGHGLSSRMPKGLRLDFIEYVLSVNRVVRHLKWTKFHLIGHSLGGQLSQYYSALFPEQVIKLIVCDAYGPAFIAMEDTLVWIRTMYEQQLEIEEKMLDSDPPNYTRKEALEKMIKNRRFPITEEAADKLVDRNLKVGKNGHYFSLDQRLKLSVLSSLTLRQITECYKSISCPFLLIVTKIMYKSLSMINSQKSDKTILGAFMTNPRFQMVVVDGYHDVHNISPEVVAEHIVPFLLKQNCSL